MFVYKLVIVTRKDLPLSPGKLAVQVAHAAVDCALQTKKNHPKWYSKWNQEGAKKVVVRVETIHDFDALERHAQKQNIITSRVRDAGLTEIPPHTETVLGIGPGPASLIDQITGTLPLL